MTIISLDFFVVNDHPKSGFEGQNWRKTDAVMQTIFWLYAVSGQKCFKCVVVSIFVSNPIVNMKQVTETC